jgi:hypothetical protein
MELAWKGYVVTLRVQRKQTEATSDPSAEEASRPASTECRREGVEKQHIMAAGSRYMGPSGPPHL